THSLCPGERQSAGKAARQCLHILQQLASALHSRPSLDETLAVSVCPAFNATFAVQQQRCDQATNSGKSHPQARRGLITCRLDQRGGNGWREAAKYRCRQTV